MFATARRGGRGCLPVVPAWRARQGTPRATTISPTQRPAMNSEGHRESSGARGWTWKLDMPCLFGDTDHYQAAIPLQVGNVGEQKLVELFKPSPEDRIPSQGKRARGHAGQFKAAIGATGKGAPDCLHVLHPKRQGGTLEGVSSPVRDIVASEFEENIVPQRVLKPPFAARFHYTGYFWDRQVQAHMM